MRTRIARIRLVAAVCLWLAACGDDSVREANDVLAADLPCAATNADGTWESAPWPPDTANCEWLRFDSGQSYAIDHPLARTPPIVLGFISFTADGARSTVAAGDMLLILDATETTVTIRNGTAQDFYLRLVLR